MTRDVLFVHAADEMYGSDFVLLEIARALRGTELNPRVVVPNDTSSELASETRLSGRLRAEGTDVHTASLAVMRRKYFTPGGALALRRRLRASAKELATTHAGAALVHSHTAAVLTGARVARLLGVPHVWHVSEIVERPALVRRFISRTVARGADRIVCVSKAVRDHILATHPAAAAYCDVIYNGIDPTPFASASGARVREELGAHDRPIVGMIGRVGTWKGQELLLEAARDVVAAHPRVLVLLVGGVLDTRLDDLDRLRRMARDLGIANNVVVQGFRDDVADLLAAMDVFVQPSVRPDPFPTTVLEAMAAGRPIVATAHGGPLEMIVNGETGYLTAPGDARALGAAIARLLDDPGRAIVLGEAGRARVRREFSRDAFRRRYLELYRSLIASRSDR